MFQCDRRTAFYRRSSSGNQSTMNSAILSLNEVKFRHLLLDRMDSRGSACSLAQAPLPFLSGLEFGPENPTLLNLICGLDEVPKRSIYPVRNL